MMYYGTKVRRKAEVSKERRMEGVLNKTAVSDNKWKHPKYGVVE
jgi:hypothetical protein